MATTPRGFYMLIESVEHEYLLQEKAPTNCENLDFWGKKVANWS